MTRERIILALVVFTAVGLSSLGTFFIPGLVLPILVFAVPNFTAVYFLSPRIVAGVAGCTTVLALLNLVMLQVSLWTTASHVVVLALVAYLSTVLAARMRRETALAEERERLLVQLQESEERYRTLAEVAQDYIFIIDRSNRVEYVNRYAAEHLELRPEEIVGKRLKDLFPPEISSRLELSVQEAFSTGKPIYRESSLPFPEQEIWLGTWLSPIRYDGGELTAIMGISRDITEQRQHEEELVFLANHDPLTGLPNRRALEVAMERVVARARRGIVSTLLFLDIDDFKIVNDSLGHAVGDQALSSLAKVLQKELRFEDLLVRLGGDEFAALLEGTNQEQAKLVAGRLCHAAEEFEVATESGHFLLSLSIGLVVIDGQNDTSRVLAQADLAMYLAKRQGGNRALCYSPEAESVLRTVGRNP